MKLHQDHPSFTAYFRDLERELFILDSGKEYGDNIFIEHLHDGVVAHKTTLAAIKIMAFDELMQADPVSKLQDALENLLKYPMDAKVQADTYKTLRATRRFGKDWKP